MKIASNFCLLFLFIFSPCKAQYNCLGGDISFIGTQLLELQDGKVIYTVPENYNYGFSLGFHIEAELNLSSHFSLIPAVGYEAWSANASGISFLNHHSSPANQPGVTIYYNYGRIVFPELIRFYPAKTDFNYPSIRLYCQAGPYYGLGIGSYLVPGTNVGFSSNIFGYKLGTGVILPLWDGFATVGLDVQSDILFAPSFDLHYPKTGAVVKTRSPLYTMLFSVGYSYPFDFRHFKFLSILDKPGTE